MQKANYNELRITVILLVKSLEKQFTLCEQIATSLCRSKNDIECILYNTGEAAAFDAKVAQSKSLTELKNTGKCIPLTGAAGEDLSGMMCKAAEVSSGGFTLVILQPESANPGNGISWINSNKKTITENTLFFGSYKPSKNSLFNRISDVLYQSSARFWLASNLSDYTSGVFALKSTSVPVLFNGPLSKASTQPQLAHLAACNGIGIQQFPLTTDKQKPVKNIGQTLLMPFTALVARWKYFVSQSLHFFKTRQAPALATGGNNPAFRLAFFIISLAFCVAYPILSQDYGMSWDEKQHNDYAQLSYQWFASFGEDTAALAEPKTSGDYVRQAYRYYGEQSNTVSALVYNTFGTDPFNTRHFINSLYGLISILFVGLTVKQLTSWRGGIIGLLFMGLNPGWLGQSMNNPTDIPFAAGFAVATYFIIKILMALPRPKFSHLVCLGIGTGIGIGSRVGAFLIIAYFGLFLAIYWMEQIRTRQPNAIKLTWPLAKIFLSASFFGYLFGIILWPFALHNPFKNPFIAFQKASENAFYAHNTELFEGVRTYMLDAPGYYAVKFLTIGNPLYIIAGIALSILLLFWIRKYVKPAYVLAFVFMIVFPLAYAEYTNINYYNGWRHYLFILPAMVVLAAIPYEFLFHALRNKVAQLALLVLVGGAFAKPLVWIISNHPNEYVYFNELVGGVKGAYGTYETDYYSNSCRAAAEWLAHQEPDKKVLVAINNEPLTASYYAQKINPKMEFMWVREYEEEKPMWDYMILTSRTFSRNELLNGSFPPKGTIYSVMADGIPLAVVVKRENGYMPMGYKAFDAHNADSAIYFFTKAVQYNEKDEEANRMLGQSYLSKMSLDTAEKYIDRSIEIYPENYSAWSNKGLVYLNRKEYDKALPFFKKATSMKRNLTEAYYYAAACELSRNNYEAAIPYLEDAIKNNGAAPEIYYNLGIAYLNTGSYNKAEKAFSGALTMNPNMAQAYQALAQTYMKLNKQEEANYCMQKYQELGGQ